MNAIVLPPDTWFNLIAACTASLAWWQSRRNHKVGLEVKSLVNGGLLAGLRTIMLQAKRISEFSGKPEDVTLYEEAKVNYERALEKAHQK